MAPSLLSFALLLVSANVVLSSIFPDQWVTDCKKQVGFEGDIGNMNYDDPAFPRPAKCYMACFMGKKKEMKADGSIDKEHSKSLYAKAYKDDEKKKQKFWRIVDECTAEHKISPDICDTAFSYVKCKRTKYDAYQ